MLLLSSNLQTLGRLAAWASFGFWPTVVAARLSGEICPYSLATNLTYVPLP